MRRTRARAAWVAAPVPAGGSSVSIMVALQIICVSPPLLRCPQLHKAGFSMLLLAAADAGWLRWIPGGRGPTGTFSSLGRTAKLLLSPDTTGLGGAHLRRHAGLSVARSRFDLCSDWTISWSVCVHGGLPTLPQQQEEQREGFHIPGWM